MKTIHEALMWRAAIKEYNKEAKLTEEDVNYLLDVVRMAPSSYGLQPYKLILVSDREHDSAFEGKTPCSTRLVFKVSPQLARRLALDHRSNPKRRLPAGRNRIVLR